MKGPSDSGAETQGTGCWRTLTGTLRPPFLLLTLACVALGTSDALAAGAAFGLVPLLLVCTGALSAHISVNMFNEYRDFRSGLDLTTAKTPFSGGSGALPARPAMAGTVLAGAWLSLAITAIIGLILAHRAGPAIFPIGLAGLILVFAYTPWINRQPFLCLVAPGLGFGLMVAGTRLVLAGNIDSHTGIAAAIPFFLVNNLLLLNQFPDAAADAEAGRRHLPIVWGTRKCCVLYLAFLAATAATIAGAVATGSFPLASLFGLAATGPGLFAWQGGRAYGVAIGRHPRYLAANAATAVLTPLVLALGIAIKR